MEDYMTQEDKDPSVAEQLDDGEISSTEEAFMKGYNEDEKVPECAECGSAIEQEQIVAREIDGEAQTFCTKSCADDFEESSGEN